jgi:hypothetical protein
MNFEELDEVTRKAMLEELEIEEAEKHPYRGKSLSPAGRTVFADLMRQAIRSGNEETLIRSLMIPGYWQPTEEYIRGNVVRERRVNIEQHAERLGLSEFNTWYVRGLAKRLMSEEVIYCQAYRGAEPRWEPGTCGQHEGEIFVVENIYRGHRARYWPEPGNPATLSIPFEAGCHHTIRRVRS